MIPRLVCKNSNDRPSSTAGRCWRPAASLRRAAIVIGAAGHGFWHPPPVFFSRTIVAACCYLAFILQAPGVPRPTVSQSLPWLLPPNWLLFDTPFRRRSRPRPVLAQKAHNPHFPGCAQATPTFAFGHGDDFDSTCHSRPLSSRVCVRRPLGNPSPPLADDQVPTRPAPRSAAKRALV